MFSADDVSTPADVVVLLFSNLYTTILLDPGSDILAHLLSYVVT